MGKTQPLIALDGHVHLHEPETLAHLLEYAGDNFRRYAPRASHRVLLLAQTSASPDFEVFRSRLNESGREQKWTLQPTREPHSWKVVADDGSEMWLIIGRQLISSEGLEVLVFGCEEGSNAMTAGELLHTTRQARGLGLLPWGVGKWLGARGKIVSTLLSSDAAQGIVLGDNGGRPALWRWVQQFSLARHSKVRVLRGSDPLPLPGEMSRVGSFGGIIRGDFDPRYPTRSLTRLLADQSVALEDFGKEMGLIRFLSNQIRLRLRKTS